MKSKKIHKIPLEKLEIDEMNSRKVGWVSDEELISSIEKVGVLEPLLVRPIDDDKYGIVCGSRRYHASIEAGLEKIPCRIEEMDDLEAKAVSLHENLQRDSLSKLETADNIEEMWGMVNSGKTYKQKIEYIGERFGYQEAQIKHYRKIGKLVDKVELAAELMKPEERRDEEVMKEAGITLTDSVNLDTLTASKIETAIEKDKVPETKEQMEKIVRIAAREKNRERRMKLVDIYPSVKHREDEEITKALNAAIELDSKREKEFLKTLEVEPKKSIDEAVESALEAPLTRKFYTRVRPRIYDGLTKAVNDKGKKRTELVRDVIQDWLESEGYL